MGVIVMWLCAKFIVVQAQPTLLPSFCHVQATLSDCRYPVFRKIRFLYCLDVLVYCSLKVFSLLVLCKYY